MQYQVPQFIEVEDKIFGPLTLKQFIYIAGNGGVCLVFFTLFPLIVAIPLSLPFVAFGLALAFYKVNDRPLIVAIEHGVKYYLGSKLYLWKQKPPSATIPATKVQKPPPTIALPSLTESRLKDLSWSLNIKDRTNMGVVEPQQPEGRSAASF